MQDCNSTDRIHFPLIVFLSLFLSSGSMLGAQLAADSLVLSPGSSGIVQVSYNSLGDQISALQFDLQFDRSVLSIIAIPGPAIRSASKNLYGADLSAGLHRTLVAGLNQNSLSDGSIVTLFLNVLPSAPVGRIPLALRIPSAPVLPATLSH